MKKHTARTHRRGWRESWTVMLEWIGDKAGVLPLIEQQLHAWSDGLGTMLGCGLNDASWTRYTKAEALGLFETLKSICRVRFSPYVRIQLFHDFKDVPIEFGKDGTIDFAQAGKGTKRIAIYRHGKAPDFSKMFRKRRA